MNQKHKASKYEGVVKYYDRWKCRYIMKDGSRRSLGVFETQEEAYAAYCHFKKFMEKNPDYDDTKGKKKTELCSCCYIQVTDDFFNLKKPDLYILVNKQKAYFCDEECKAYYLRHPLVNRIYKVKGQL